MIWVTQYVDNSLGAVDLGTQSLTDSVRMLSGPLDSVLLPDESRIFVSNSLEDKVSVIDTQDPQESGTTADRKNSHPNGSETGRR